MDYVTSERLRSLLHYDLESGEWTWLVRRGNSTPIGSPAGSRNTKGYLYIKVDGIKYLASHLAYLYVFGDMPLYKVVYRDRDNTNLSWSNLISARPPDKKPKYRKLNRRYWNMKKRLQFSKGALRSMAESRRQGVWEAILLWRKENPEREFDRQYALAEANVDFNAGVISGKELNQIQESWRYKNLIGGVVM